MATYFEVRIADEGKTYAAQAAQAALDLLDQLESHLSRFRANSDIAQIAQLAPGETLRLSEPAFACLEVAKKMELATRGGFCPTPAALHTQASQPQWRFTARAAFHPLREGAVAIRSGRHRQGVCAGPHGGTAAGMGLPLVFACGGGQQHPGGRRAEGCGRLVLRTGRRPCAATILSDPRVVERLGASSEGRPYSRSAHRRGRPCGRTGPGP